MEARSGLLLTSTSNHIVHFFFPSLKLPFTRHVIHFMASTAQVRITLSPTALIYLESQRLGRKMPWSNDR